MGLANLKSKLNDNWRGGAIGSACALLFSLTFLISPLGKGLRNWSYDLPISFHEKTKPADVVVVYMDDESHTKLRQPLFGSWDRAVHAQLVNRLRSYGARAIAFDVLFDLLDTNRPASDRLFIEALSTHRNVVLGAKMQSILAPNGQTTGFKTVLPADEFRKASAGWGLAEGGGSDKAIRQHYRGDERIPSLVFKVAKLTMSSPPDPSLPRWMNYYGPPGTIDWFPYWEVLSNSIPLPSMAFSNKVVFVGARYDIGYTGGVGTDDFITPYTWKTDTKAPGVEINATAYSNLRYHEWLKEFSAVTEFLMIVALAVLFGYGLLLVRPWIAAALAFSGFLAVTVAAFWLVWRQNCWFPWLIVGGVQIPTALGWALIWNTRKLWQENELLEEKLSTALSGVSPRPSPPILSSPLTDSSLSEAVTSVTAPPPGRGDSGPQIPDHDLVRRVGKGAYGEVWLARDVIGSFHAVKIVYRRTFSNDGPFDREFKGIQKFTPISRQHPGFVHVLHVGRNNPGGYFYYVMEAGDDEVTGQNISPDTYVPKNLAREIDKRGKFPFEESLQLSLDLTAALDYLHQQHLIHRDIKPSNVIFVRGAPKIADIGLVTEIADSGRETTYLGTEGYIPPEGPGTAAGDVYSLGKVIYEVSMGRNLGHFPDLPTTLIERSDRRELLQLNEIIFRACEPNLRIRYPSMAELRADLLRLRNEMRPRQ